jgi:long-chain acyl-CoA synthetase
LARAPAEPQPVEIEREDTAVLMYTGGTTGISKGAQLTHRNILANVCQCIAWVGAAPAQEVTLAALPLFHSYGMTCCMNPGSLTAGTAILIPDPRDINDILKSIHRHRPTLFPGVPAMYIAINNHPAVDKYDLSSIKFCNSGAAPLPPKCSSASSNSRRTASGRLWPERGLAGHSQQPLLARTDRHDRCCPGRTRRPRSQTRRRVSGVLGAGQVGELCARPAGDERLLNLPTETANVLRPDPQGGDPGCTPATWR